MGSNYSKCKYEDKSTSLQQIITTQETSMCESIRNSNITAESFSEFEMDNNADPRSPTLNVCRTPVNDFSNKKKLCEQFGISPSTAEALKDKDNPKGILKSKLLKELNSKLLIDPRSPNPFINRTPIVFDESSISTTTETDTEQQNEDTEIDKSINLNDTFSDLFVDNNLSPSSSSFQLQNSIEMIKKNVSNENIMKNVDVLKDPRSPSFDVERTPIIFSDDDDSDNDKNIDDNDDEMIENFINMLQVDDRNDNNKLQKKKSIKVTQKMIYEDRIMECSSTPKGKDQQMNAAGTIIMPKRTPLSCMGNTISHLKKDKNIIVDGGVNNNVVKQTKMKFNFNRLSGIMNKHSAVEDIINEKN